MSLPGQAEDHNELSPDCAGCTEDTLPAEPDALRRKAALGCLVLPGQRQVCEMCHGSRPRMGKSPGHTPCAEVRLLLAPGASGGSSFSVLFDFLLVLNVSSLW